MTTSEKRRQVLLELLSWSTDLVPIDLLVSSVRGNDVAKLSADAAISFDANVFLKIGKGSRASELIDYLAGPHNGPIIVSAQGLLELWNNHLSSIDTLTSKLKKQLEDINKSIEEIDAGYSELRDGASSLVRSFQSEYGHVFSPTTQVDLLALLEMLSEKAISSQVDRAAFSPLAAMRKRFKAPPGFKDDGDGDFFVWVELLNGLLMAKEQSRHFDSVLLVTDDTKKDWSTGGTPHPILAAEVRALVDVPFYVMPLADLKKAVREAV
jgi:hypothetical protein